MPNPLCDLWNKLLHQAADRGQIYSDFMTERLALVAHLTGCRRCQVLVNRALPVDISILDLDSLTTKDFEEFIKELWAQAECCRLWKALLNDQANRGKIYDDCKREHMVLAGHFQWCKTCQNLVKAVLPTGVFTPVFHQMTDDQFAFEIRELWKFARNKRVP